jgi:hypothetical protein
MQALSATAVTALILFVADQLLNAGRYSEVVADALVQVGLLVGINDQKPAARPAGASVARRWYDAAATSAGALGRTLSKD